MIHAKGLLLATIIAVTLPMYTQAHAETSPENFTSAKFLERSVENQDGYISIAVSMAAVVASRFNPDMADCIGAWYSADALDRRNVHIRSTMQEHSEFHPMGVILAVIEKRCGTFRRR